MPWELPTLWRVAQIATYLVFGLGAVMALHLELLLLGARRSGIDRPTRRSDWIRRGALMVLGVVFFFPPLALRDEDDCHCFDDEIVVAPVPVLFLTPLLMIPGNDLLTGALWWSVFLPELAGVFAVSAALTWVFGKAWTVPEPASNAPAN